MTEPIMAIDLGCRDYEECWDLQHRVHKARKEGLLPDCLLLVEHPHVFTLGKRAKEGNLLVTEHCLREKGIPCIAVERGGDVTYHGPGQLVGYPIFLLRGRPFGVVDFVGRLEEVMIRCLGDYSIRGERNERNRGVWVGVRKIGFVGIAVRSGISLHGFALNVAPELSYFEMIHPCGLAGVEVTSLRALLGRDISMQDVKEAAVRHIREVFGTPLEWAFPERIEFLAVEAQNHTGTKE